jgi:hypothetical protein
VAGFSLSAVGGGLLLMSAGFSSIISVVCSALGIFYSRRGKANVEKGETTKHRQLAQAGFVIGLVSAVLSVLATLFWIAFFVILATDEGFRRDFNDGNFGNGRSISQDLSLALFRVVAGLLG